MTWSLNDTSIIDVDSNILIGDDTRYYAFCTDRDSTKDQLRVVSIHEIFSFTSVGIVVVVLIGKAIRFIIKYYGARYEVRVKLLNADFEKQ
jgi:hypothetical protein